MPCNYLCHSFHFQIAISMKNLFALLLMATVLMGCPGKDDPVTEEETKLKDGLANGEWSAASTAGGFDNYTSYKNFHYTFEVAEANQVVSFDLISGDIDLQYALFDPLGNRVATSTRGRQISAPYTAKSAGIHRIVVSADRRAIGKFSLKVTGTKAGVEPVSFQTLRSETQNWGPLGGGAGKKTFKNHFYTFEVVGDNSAVDVELLSADTDVSLYLYDNLGALVTARQANRYEYIIQPVNKGVYTVMAGTESRGSVGNYNLNLFGKVQNLKRVTASSETKPDKWSAGKIQDILHKYSLDITSEANSPLDIELSSPDVNVVIELQDKSGANIGGIYGAQKSQFFISKDLPKGSYRIQVRPSGTLGGNTSGGKYDLTVVGQFANLKKM
jgi:hypothetical protein